MPFLKQLITDTLHLFYPHICSGCDSDLLVEKTLLCLKCINELPHTHFASLPDNPVEKYFWGRLNLEAAHSEFYFSKESLVQQLVHQLKYRANTPIGFYLGQFLGNSLLQSKRFDTVDTLVPLPLYPDKEKKRGYNQATIICNGMASVMHLPLMTGNIRRQRFTETQTRKNRTERWENVEGSFSVNDPVALKGRHILLVDDVVTTGATMEACGRVMKTAGCARLSIATLAVASK